MPGCYIRPGIRTQVLARDGYVCQICRDPIVDKRLLTYDHILPRCKGGRTTLENLRVACLPCNNARGDGTFDDEKFHKVRAKIIRKLSRKISSVAMPIEMKRGGSFPVPQKLVGQVVDLSARYAIPEKYQTAVAACQASRLASQTFEEKLAAQKQDEERLERETLASWKREDALRESSRDASQGARC